jgi:hypothetical protein
MREVCLAGPGTRGTDHAEFRGGNGERGSAKKRRRCRSIASDLLISSMVTLPHLA